MQGLTAGVGGAGGGGGGREWLPYISLKGMSFPKGYGFWAFLVWKQVYILEPGMVFKGTMRVYTCESIDRFNFKWVRKKEKIICKFALHSKFFLVYIVALQSK